MPEAKTPSASTQNENQRMWMQFQQNLKQSALGIKFGKKLFTNPKNMTAKEINSTLRALGMNVPKEMEVAADLAQLWTTGQAVVDTYETARTANDAKSAANFTNVSLAAARMGTNYMEQSGMVNDDMASVMRVGISAARLVASGGADVSAWIDIAMEFGSQSEMAKGRAMKRAYENIQNMYQDRIREQKTAVTEIIGKLERKELGLFSFLVEFADQGSILFENCVQKNPKMQFIRDIFPGLDFFPYGEHKFFSTTQAKTWFGDTQGAQAEISVRAVYDLNKDNAFDYMFKWIVEPYALGFQMANLDYEAMGKASIFSYAILANIAENGDLTKNGDILSQFNNYCLTPYDIGVFDTWNNYIKPNDSTAITSNFGFVKKRATLTKDQMRRADMLGRIDIISKVNESKDLLLNKFNYPPLDWEKYITNYQIERKWSSPAYVTFRSPANFITTLSMLEAIRQDPKYVEWIQKSEVLQKYNCFPQIDRWMSLYEETWKLSVLRRVNKMALVNVQEFMGTTEIKKVNEGEVGPAIFQYK